VREFKFRAWDRNRGRWINVGRFYDVTNSIQSTAYTSELYPTYEHDEMKLDVVLMQYTGLKDKNGRDIYEGDILEIPLFEPSRMQITFIEGAFCLADKSGEYSADIHYIHHADREQAEVIGNIYEHPELLEAG
jgi:uncharacterized phage protein (TIGR01671 family)